MEIAMLGLGRMGANMARRLLRDGHRVVVWNRTYAKAEELAAEGAEPVRELTDVVAALAGPRVIWLDAAPRRANPGGDRRARPAARRGRHPHRRRQLTVPARRRARRRAGAARHPLPGCGHERRRLGPRYRLLPHGRRRPVRLRPHRPAASHAGAARSRLRLHGRSRQRPFRQDGPQRHRVRTHAGLCRGFRAARSDGLGSRPGGDRRLMEQRQRGALLAPRAGRRRLPQGSWPAGHQRLRRGLRAKAAGRSSKRSPTASRCP